MKNLASLALASLLSTTLVGCLTGDNELPADDQDVQDAAAPKQFPRTCAELVKANPSATDGAHTLYVGGDERKPWTAHCADLATTSPKEYLSTTHYPSVSIYGGANFEEVSTTYEKVRIDPLTLELDIHDQRFATSTGRTTDPNGAVVTSVPLGVGVSCGGGAYGHATLSVLGTRFAVDSDFVVSSGGAGEALAWDDDQLIDMWTLGACSTIGPVRANLQATTDFAIKLVYKQ